MTMSVKKALQGRRSIRFFDGKPVEEEVLKNIIHSAQWTPSWDNAQPWRVYVATGKTLEKIKEAHLGLVRSGVPGHPEMETAHREDWGIKAQQNMGEWWQGLQKSLMPGHSQEYGESQASLFNASALIYLTIHKNSPLWALYDTGSFGQSLMLAAYEQGIDSMPAYEIVKYPQYVRELMGIPDDERLIMGIALGYRSDKKINDFRSNQNLGTGVNFKNENSQSSKKEAGLFFIYSEQESDTQILCLS